MKTISTLLLLLITATVASQTVVYADEKYGFDANNSQSFFYDAIDGEKGTGNTLVFRDMGSPWYLVDQKRRFDVDDLTIIFEPGCVVEAKQGEWNSNEKLLYILRATNLNIIGYGATFKMYKSDFPDGEFGHSISIARANNVSVRGLTLDGSGGDGLYIVDWNNSFIEDVDAVGHKRQGISVISCNQFDVLNSRFRNTSGTAPEAGVDIEPNNYQDDVIGCRFDKCSFTGNDYVGIVAALSFTDSRAAPVDIEFSNCYTSNNNIEPPYLAGAINASGSGDINENERVDLAVNGLVTFRNIAIDGDPRGLWFNRKQFNGYKAVLDNVVGINLSESGSLPLIGFETPSYFYDAGNGGVDFNNVLVHTTANVTPFSLRGTNASAPGDYLGFQDVGGKITVVEPFGNAPEYINYDPANNVNVDYEYSNQPSLPTTTVNIGAVVTEASKSGQVGRAKITRTSSRVDYPLFVKYSVSSPQVSQGDDIHYLTGAVVIEAGKTSADIEIVARDNGVSEQARPITLSLENRVLYNIGNNSSAQISVVDSETNTPVDDEIWLEAECATVGADWSVVDDASVSGGQYLIPPSGNNFNTPPTNAGSLISFDFDASAGTYKIHGRVRAPSGSQDSFWVRVNGGIWSKWNLIEKNTDFIWDEVHNQPGSNTPVPITFDLVDGANTVDFAHREEGAALDKIYIAGLDSNPSGFGETASNCNGDTIAPMVTSITAIDITGVSFKVDWTLDEGSTGQVEWGLTNALGNQTTLEQDFLTRHIQLVNGLEESTEYFYRVTGADVVGNSFTGDIRSITTSDATPPTVTSIATTDVKATSFNVDWSLDEGSTGRVEWGLTSSLGNQTKLEQNYLTRHIQLVKNLNNATTYYYRVVGEDLAGNSFIGDVSSVTTLSSTSAKATNIIKILDESKSRIRLYPNPTANVIEIKGIDGKKNIVVTDFTGKVLLDRKLSRSETSIDVSGFVPGNYHVRILSRNRTEVFQVFKK